MSSGRVAREDEQVAVEPVERRARSGRRRRCRAARPGRRPRPRRTRPRSRARRRRRAGRRRAARGRLDDPVHHPPAEQRVEVLRRRRAHARAEPGGHARRLRGRRAHLARIVLGRQDSNLGSRDQNPLPYHLATPQVRPQCATPQRRSEKRSASATSGEDRDDEQRDPPDDATSTGTSMTSACETAAIQPTWRTVSDLRRSPTVK